jgi:hypothetical protein
VTYKRALRVQPSPDINTLVPVTVGYLKGMTIQPVASVCKPGAALSLQAQGIDTSDPTFNYRWRVVQGPEVVLAGADKPTVGLILPQVSVSTIMVIQLEASTTADHTGQHSGVHGSGGGPCQSNDFSVVLHGLLIAFEQSSGQQRSMSARVKALADLSAHAWHSCHAGHEEEMFTPFRAPHQACTWWRTPSSCG